MNIALHSENKILIYLLYGLLLLYEQTMIQGSFQFKNKLFRDTHFVNKKPKYLNKNIILKTVLDVFFF